jgi:hypothetical protein
VVGVAAVTNGCIRHVTNAFLYLRIGASVAELAESRLATICYLAPKRVIHAVAVSVHG